MTTVLNYALIALAIISPIYIVISYIRTNNECPHCKNKMDKTVCNTCGHDINLKWKVAVLPGLIITVLPILITLAMTIYAVSVAMFYPTETPKTDSLIVEAFVTFLELLKLFIVLFPNTIRIGLMLVIIGVTGLIKNNICLTKK